MKTKVFCTLQIEGVHKWSDCPISEVNYLRHEHRHMFFIKAYKWVNHDDRDIEFIEFKHTISKTLREDYYDSHLELHNFGNRSCEMIGASLMEQFDLCQLEISEDNENGCLIIEE
jgi:hypothetical protein